MPNVWWLWDCDVAQSRHDVSVSYSLNNLDKTTHGAIFVCANYIVAVDQWKDMVTGDRLVVCERFLDFRSEPSERLHLAFNIQVQPGNIEAYQERV